MREVDARYVEKYYDAADEYIEELMWWHTLVDDNSPLAYVVALEFASLVGCKTCLDFGSGVGSGALLFRSRGFDVTLADISRMMLSFCKYRFDARGLDASFINLKHSKLPANAFDFITAMDVFEHLVDPAGTVDLLHHCLKPGGYVYGRFASEIDPDRPEHIVQDFQPVFGRFAELGFHFKKSFATNGSGATKCSEKAGAPENQNPEYGARPRDLSGDECSLCDRSTSAEASDLRAPLSTIFARRKSRHARERRSLAIAVNNLAWGSHPPLDDGAR